MSASDYEGIVEIRTVSLDKANRLLMHGYRLVAVEAEAKGVERQNPEGGAIGASFYVAKYLVFVIGRTEDQRPIVDWLTEWNNQARAAREEAAASRLAVAGARGEPVADASAKGGAS